MKVSLLIGEEPLWIMQDIVIYPQFFYDKMPMSEFKQNIENLPYFIVEDIKHAKAKKLISKLKYPECVIFSEQRHTDKS